LAGSRLAVIERAARANRGNRARCAPEPLVRQQEATPTMIWDEGLLYIEPAQPASSEPVLDHLTRKMAAAFRKARLSEWRSCGVHECVCGAHSTSRDYRLPNGEVTNALCVHYVAHHRPEVPAGQLARIEAF